MKPTLGYVGVGLMGLPMVKRLAPLGYAIRAFDIVAAQVEASQAAGATAAASAADAARGADLVILNLPTTDAVEHAMFGTSLGVDLETGKAIHGGHRHHMRAINTVCRAGGLAQAVEQGVLGSGIMYECIRHKVNYVLAGSIRDDGPIPDTIMDLKAAQDQYAAALVDVKLVIVLSTMLHGIGVGNMLPSAVRVVCIDINPAVVTKLCDRGTFQAVGLVTDVEPFLRELSQYLRQGDNPADARQ